MTDLDHQPRMPWLKTHHIIMHESVKEGGGRNRKYDGTRHGFLVDLGETCQESLMGAQASIASRNDKQGRSIGRASAKCCDVAMV